MLKSVLRGTKGQPKIILYRILGNDLPPRHKVGQTFDNLNFILHNEPDFANCQKKWIVNRIFDKRMEGKIIKLLEKHRKSYIHIPFVLGEYSSNVFSKIQIVDDGIHREAKSKIIREIKRFKKISYVTNLNATRNFALSEGKRLADWILPFDGNCCFDNKGLQGVINKLSKQKKTNKCFAVPMFRLKKNEQYFAFTSKGHEENEPQIVFGKDTDFKFSLAYVYGNAPKVELMGRMFKLKITDHGITVADPEVKCGYVLRLSSGTKDEFMNMRGPLRDISLDKIFKRIEKSVLAHRYYR